MMNGPVVGRTTMAATTATTEAALINDGNDKQVGTHKIDYNPKFQIRCKSDGPSLMKRAVCGRPTENKHNSGAFN